MFLSPSPPAPHRSSFSKIDFNISSGEDKKVSPASALRSTPTAAASLGSWQLAVSTLFRQLHPRPPVHAPPSSQRQLHARHSVHPTAEHKIRILFWIALSSHRRHCLPLAERVGAVQMAWPWGTGVPWGRTLPGCSPSSVSLLLSAAFPIARGLCGFFPLNTHALCALGPASALLWVKLPR